MNIDSPDIMSASSDAPVENPQVEETVEESSTSTETPEPEAQAEEEGQPGDDAAAEKPKKKGIQDRIDELTAKRREAEREAQYWRELAEKTNKPQDKPEQGAPAKPSFDDFTSVDDYERAIEQYALDKAAHEASQAQKQQAQMQAQYQEQRLNETFTAKSAEFAAQNPDYYAVVQNPGLKVTEDMAKAIKHSDQGPGLAYHLGKHPDLAEQIAALPAHLQYMEIGKIAATLTAPAPKLPPMTKAPAPVKPIGSKAVVDKAPEEMTNSEYRAWRTKQMKRT